MLRSFLFAAGLLALTPSLVRAQMAALTSGADDSGQLPAPAAASAAPVIYHTAEQLPAFPGGDAALLKFLKSRLQYPAAALDHSISGKVYVAFVVDSEGRLRNPQVVKGLGYGLDEEALRLVRLMPWWTPGQSQGQPVWVHMTLPIVFRAL